MSVHRPVVTAAARVSTQSDLVLIDSGFDSETFNVACRARLSQATAASRIDEALAFFGAPERPFSWWSGPGDTPAGLPGLLEEAGLRRSESLIGMSLRLSRLTAPPMPTDLEIRRVRTPADLEAFAALLDARADGHETAVLQASAAGERVYRRLGFAPFGSYAEFKPGRGTATSGP